MKLHFWQLAPKASCANLLMTFFFMDEIDQVVAVLILDCKSC